MPIRKNLPEQQRQLQNQLQYILKLTCFGLVTWKRTADPNETFTTSFRGLFVATVWEDTRRKYLRLVSSKEQSHLLATSADSDLVNVLYSEVRRRAFNVHKAITDIILSRS
jgi:hypothetical protein